MKQVPNAQGDALVAGRGSLAIRGAGLRAVQQQFAQLEREQNDLRQALFSAAQLHRRLSAARQVRKRRFEIASEVFSVRHIAGDFCQVQEHDRALVLGVGDIAGKGLAAGLWFTHMIGLLRLQAAAPPAAALAAINRHLCEFPPEPPLVALFLARLDAETGELSYCNAGQPPALVLRRDAKAEFLRDGGPMLGATREAAFRCGRVQLGPGDALIASSDGIVECRNAREEEFGSARLLAAARGAARQRAGKMVFSLLGAAQDFAGNHPRADDLTLMVVRRDDRDRKLV